MFHILIELAKIIPKPISIKLHEELIATFGMEKESLSTAALETGEAVEMAPEAATVAKRTVALESGEAAETAPEAAAVERTVALETGEESMALAASVCNNLEIFMNKNHFAIQKFFFLSFPSLSFFFFFL